MSEKVGDFVLRRLAEWGIHRIYGYPGDGINGLLGALGRAGKRVDFIQTRHEEMAAFMACAHAKFTGEVGLCMATSGPGAIHLLNGLYDARLDNQPVVAIVGQQKRMSLGGDFQQEVDLPNLFKDVAGEYVQMVTVPEQTRHVIDRAVRIAKAERTVTCVVIPNDVQEMAYSDPPRLHGAVMSGIGYHAPNTLPHERDLRRAAEVLNAGKRVAMLVGAGALNASEQVIEIAEILQAGIAKALLGKAVVPDALPFVTGAIGLLGTRPSYEMMSHCDTLLMIGSTFPYSEFLPREGQARGVQIDINPRKLSIRYPMKVNLVGDSAQTLDALIGYLKPKARRGQATPWRRKIERDVKRWWQVLESRAMNKGEPINPQRAFWELSSRLPDNCIITADSGSGTNWYARDIKIRKGMMASLSGGLATMGCGIPYAVAAKFAHPDRPVIALVGDGAMQMNGNSELVTVSKYWERWSNPAFIVMVLNNRDLNQVTWEQRALAGDPKYEASQNIPDFPYARYGELLGFKGFCVEKPDDLGPTWEKAFAAQRPVIIDVYVDPNVPPLPPHVSFKQAVAYSESIWKGDVQAVPVVRRSVAEFIDSLFPRRV